MYKSKQLESTFIEVFYNKKKIFIGCIYRYPSKELSEFNNHYLTNLLDSSSNENKKVVLVGDFHANLLKYDNDRNISMVKYIQLLFSLILQAKFV